MNEIMHYASLSSFLSYISFVFSGYLCAPYALRGKKFDAIFVYAPSPLLQALPAIFVAWLKGAPIVLWVQDIWPDALASTGFIKNRWILRLVGLAVRYIYHFSDSILIQSEGFRTFVERWTGSKERIRFYPNTVEEMPVEVLTEFKDSSTANDVARGFSVVFAGNIGTAQSCETIIEAASLLQSIPEIKFYLIGGGSMAKSIGNNIAACQLENVVMTGRVPAEDMPPIYASASVLLLTLRDEPALLSTIPSKLQSYLAAGKPIIASATGESANIVNNASAGLTCPAGDAGALAEAVIKLYELPVEKRVRFGQNGRKYYETHYHLQTRVTELVEHLKDVSGVFGEYQTKKGGLL